MGNPSPQTEWQVSPLEQLRSFTHLNGYTCAFQLVSMLAQTRLTRLDLSLSAQARPLSPVPGQAIYPSRFGEDTMLNLGQYHEGRKVRGSGES